MLFDYVFCQKEQMMDLKIVKKSETLTKVN